MIKNRCHWSDGTPCNCGDVSNCFYVAPQTRIAVLWENCKLEASCCLHDLIEDWRALSAFVLMVSLVAVGICILFHF